MLCEPVQGDVDVVLAFTGDAVYTDLPLPQSLHKHAEQASDIIERMQDSAFACCSDPENSEQSFLESLDAWNSQRLYSQSTLSPAAQCKARTRQEESRRE